jgi:hypothetical protein
MVKHKNDSMSFKYCVITIEGRTKTFENRGNKKA